MIMGTVKRMLLGVIVIGAAVMVTAGTITAPAARAATPPTLKQRQALLRTYLSKTKPVVDQFIGERSKVARVMQVISGPLWVPTFDKAADTLDTFSYEIDALAIELRPVKPPAQLREPHAQLIRAFTVTAAGLRSVTTAYRNSGDQHFYSFEGLLATARAANSRLHYWGTETLRMLRQLRMTPPFWVSNLAGSG